VNTSDVRLFYMVAAAVGCQGSGRQSELFDHQRHPPQGWTTSSPEVTTCRRWRDATTPSPATWTTSPAT